MPNYDNPINTKCKYFFFTLLVPTFPLNIRSEKQLLEELEHLEKKRIQELGFYGKLPAPYGSPQFSKSYEQLNESMQNRKKAEEQKSLSS